MTNSTVEAASVSGLVVSSSSMPVCLSGMGNQAAKAKPECDENQLWIVIAAWNEAQRLPSVLRGLARRKCQIVVVDDGSSDTTAQVAMEHDVWVLRHWINRGQGAALRTGIDFALAHGATEIITFDADGQHAASDIDALLAPLRDGRADMCVGSRFLGSAPGIPFLRVVLLKLAVVFTRITTGFRLTDAHNGLRAMTAQAAQALDFSEDGMAHASQILSIAARKRLRLEEVPCTITYTSTTLEKGQSNRAAFRILGRLLIVRLTR
ncbi:MAG: glycosyltransferase family 2 protein [Pirellulaceae bacterium]